MPIFSLDSSFGEVQDRSKDHLDPMSRTFILNLFKICASRPEMKCRLEAPIVVSHTLTDGYKKVNIGGHFHSSITSHSLSSFDWFEHLGGSSSSTRGKLQQGEFSVFDLGF